LARRVARHHRTIALGRLSPVHVGSPHCWASEWWAHRGRRPCSGRPSRSPRSRAGPASGGVRVWSRLVIGTLPVDAASGRRRHPTNLERGRSSSQEASGTLRGLPCRTTYEIRCPRVVRGSRRSQGPSWLADMPLSWRDVGPQSIRAARGAAQLLRRGTRHLRSADDDASPWAIGYREGRGRASATICSRLWRSAAIGLDAKRHRSDPLSPRSVHHFETLRDATPTEPRWHTSRST
jgi:hypothetical protein